MARPLKAGLARASRRLQDRGFERGFRRGYVRVLAILFKRWFIVPVIAALMLTLGGVMLTVVGRDFFLAIDGGQIKLHVRAPAETRIEATEGSIFQDVEDLKSAKSFRPKGSRPHRRRFPAPQRPYNLAFTDGSDHQRQRRRDPDLAEGWASL